MIRGLSMKIKIAFTFIILTIIIVFVTSVWTTISSESPPPLSEPKAKPSNPSNPLPEIKTEEPPKQKILSEAKKLELQNEIRQYLIQQNINGTVLVGRKGEILFNEGNGYSNMDTMELLQPTTTYSVGSISKCFIAVSILQLCEQGSMALSDPISKFIPAFPNGQNITLTHLLSHTSGLSPIEWKTEMTTLTDFRDAIMKTPPLYQPGAKWDYQDVNYMLLSSIIEQVTGQTIHDYINNHVFQKAGMTSTTFIKPQGAGMTSTSYEFKDNHLKPFSGFNYYLVLGNGDVVSTTEDMYKFDESLMNGKLISQKSVEDMLTPRSDSTYGLGIYNNSTYFHNRGVLLGWESQNQYYLKDHIAVIIMENVRVVGRDIGVSAINISDITRKYFEVEENLVMP